MQILTNRRKISGTVEVQVLINRRKISGTCEGKALTPTRQISKHVGEGNHKEEEYIQNCLEPDTHNQ